MAMSNLQLFPKFVIRTGGDVVSSLCYVRNTICGTSLLAAGTEKGTVQLWCLKSQTVKQTLNAPGDDNSTILSLHTLFDDAGLLVYSRSHSLRYYRWSQDKPTMDLVRVYKANRNCPNFCGCDCLLHEKGKVLVAVGGDDVIQFLLINQQSSSIEPCGELLGYKELSHTVTCLKLFQSNSYKNAIVGTESGNVLLFRLEFDGDTLSEHSLASSLAVSTCHPVICLDFNCETSIGVSALAGDGHVTIWKLVNNEICHHRTVETMSNGYNQVKVRKDSKLFVCCAWNGIVRLYTIKKANLLAVLDFHRESCLTCVFDEDFNFITSSKDGVLSFWDLYSCNK